MSLPPYEVSLYLHVARAKTWGAGAFKVKATMKQNNAALKDGKDRPLPTVHFRLKLRLPRSKFDQATQLVEIEVPEERMEISASVEPLEGEPDG